MKKIFEIHLRTENPYADDSRWDEVVCSASTFELAKAIARLKCESDKKDYDGAKELSFEDGSVGFDDNGVEYHYYTKEAKVYDSIEEYASDLKAEEERARLRSIAHGALLDFRSKAGERPCYLLQLAWEIEECADHTTVDFWNKEDHRKHYQCQYDGDTLVWVRSWEGMLPNGKPDPETCKTHYEG